VLFVVTIGWRLRSSEATASWRSDCRSLHSLAKVTSSTPAIFKKVWFGNKKWITFKIFHYDSNLLFWTLLIRPIILQHFEIMAAPSMERWRIKDCTIRWLTYANKWRTEMCFLVATTLSIKMLSITIRKRNTQHNDSPHNVTGWVIFARSDICAYNISAE